MNIRCEHYLGIISPTGFNKKAIVGILLSGILAFSPDSFANLVKNGNFSNGATDWTITSPIHNYYFTALGWEDGAYKNNPDTFSQAINTIAGETYTLSYTFSTRTNQSGLIFKSLWGGIVEQIITVPNITPTTYTFTYLLATSNSTTLSFISGNDPFFNVLTNVVLTQNASSVPEPSIFALLAVGFFGVASLRKKNQPASNV